MRRYRRYLEVEVFDRNQMAFSKEKKDRTKVTVITNQPKITVRSLAQPISGDYSRKRFKE